MAIYSVVERIRFVATTVWQGVTWIKRCTVLQPYRDHELGFPVGRIIVTAFT